MRKIILLLTIQILLVIYNLYGQPVLYGVTPGGGQSIGTIYRLETKNNSLETAYDFPDNPRHPGQFSATIQASDGKLYGMTTYGGVKGGGTIFSFDPVTNTLTKVHDFTSQTGGYPNGSQDGSTPQGSLVQASNGKLYGVTLFGGAGGTSNTVGAGTIFSFEPASKTFIKLHDFINSSDGWNPNGSLVQGNNGKLYGTTSEGGSSYYGTIFSFDPVTNTYSKLHDFAGPNGTFPAGSLVQATNGKFYGVTRTTSGGFGNNNFGTIFSFDPATNTHSKLFDFTNANGRNPSGSLIQAGNGQLYGMTTRGGTNNYGTIFSFNPVTNNHSKLLDFINSNGSQPAGSLLEAGNGNLYGMTTLGGNNGEGTIFSFVPSTNTHTKLHDFSIINGGFPYGNLVQANDGKFYGATTEGGVVGDGTIFSYDPVTNIYLKRYDFINTNGKFPYGNLVQATNGKLYGMNSQGGSDDYGTIFSIESNTNIFTKLHDFSYADGSIPKGSLMQAGNGKLYGMTGQGGSNDGGVIFSFDPATNSFTKLHDFTGVNGGYPNGSLIEASNGKLYGLTVGGGSDDEGTIFSFDPVSNTHSKLYDFTYEEGTDPFGSLVQASNGKLYGMTYLGGSEGYGAIFSFDPATNLYNKLLDFNKANGANPFGSLIQANNGKLYGMTYGGGSNFGGIIFSFDPATNIQNKVYDFNSADGDHPFGSFLQATDGKLYGFNFSGGSGHHGTIFSFDPATNSHVKLQDFNENKGAGTHDGALIELIACNPAEIVTITAGGPTTFCTGGSVVLTASAGTTFLWSNGKTSQSISVSASGNYTVTRINANGCSATSASVAVSVIPVPTQPAVINGNSNVCAGSKQVYSVAAMAGVSDYTWKLPAGWSGTSTTNTISTTVGNTGGIITVKRNNTCGSSADKTLNISITPIPAPPAITPSGTLSLCTGEFILLKATLGTGYTYQWKKSGANIAGAIQSNYTATTAGVYTVVVTNAAGCSVTSAATTIIVNAVPIARITAGGPLTFCAGKSVILKAYASAGYTYQWKKGGVNIAGATLANHTATVAGVYTVVVKNAAGCSVTSAATTVVVNASPIARITAGGPLTFCAGKSVVLKAYAVAGYSYQWKKGGVNIVGATLANHTATVAGLYTVVVTNAAGCSVTSAATIVIVNAVPIARITAGGPLTFCTGKSVLLKAYAVAGYSYQWKKGGVNIAGATLANYTATITGVYSVVVINAAGCSATSAATTVVVNSLPVSTITAAGPLTFCAGKSVLLKAYAGAGYTYQWKKSGVNIIGATLSNYTATVSGVYSVVITNAAGCSITSAGTMVLANPVPVAAVAAAGPLIFCAGNNVLLKANTGTGYTYQWKKSGVNIIGATLSNYTATLSGIYTVAVTNVLGCVTTSAGINVTVNPVPVAMITPGGPLTLPAGGNVVLKATTGPGYTNQWKKDGVIISGAINNTYAATLAGVYTVVIANSNSCQATSQPVQVLASPAALITKGAPSYRQVEKDQMNPEPVIKVFPNPLHGDAYLNFDWKLSNADKGIQVTIFDISGRKIESRVLNSSDKKLRIKGVSGMYLVEIRWGKNERKIFQIIKI